MDRKIFCLIIAIIVVFAICGIRIFIRSEVVSIDGGFRQVMGTFAHVIAISDNKTVANRSIEAAFERLRYVDETMSDYNPESELSQVNRNAFAKPVKVNGHLFEVLSIAVEYSKKSGGAFDVTIGPVVDLWRRAEENKQKPAEEALAEAKSKVGYEKLVLDGEKKTVKFAVEGMRLDLGAIAKGYAIDMAVEAMKKSGAIGGMVDVGGDIRCFGKPKAGKKYWVIGLQDPAADGNILLKLKMPDMAVATSGDYRRFVLIEGEKFSHIMNPQKGVSAGQFSSVSVIAPKAVDADALATAVSVMGQQKGLELVEGLAGIEAILISSEAGGKLRQSSGAAMYINECEGDGMYKNYEVERAAGAVELKGRWNGQEWGGVEAIELKHYMGSEPEHSPKTEVKVLYDDDFIYVIFRVEDRFVRAVAKKYQDSVYQDSCVEFFFTPSEDISAGYFNIEINCGGTMLFSHQKAREVDNKVVSDADCGKVKIFHSEPKIVELEKQEATTWVIEYKVPFDVLEKYAPVDRPEVGIVWRANFYKCGDATSQPHWLTWSVIDRPKPDFHVPECFGTLEFK